MMKKIICVVSATMLSLSANAMNDPQNRNFEGQVDNQSVVRGLKLNIWSFCKDVDSLFGAIFKDRIQSTLLSGSNIYSFFGKHALEYSYTFEDFLGIIQSGIVDEDSSFRALGEKFYKNLNEIYPGIQDVSWNELLLELRQLWKANYRDQSENEVEFDRLMSMPMLLHDDKILYENYFPIESFKANAFAYFKLIFRSQDPNVMRHRANGLKILLQHCANECMAFNEGAMQEEIEYVCDYFKYYADDIFIFVCEHALGRLAKHIIYHKAFSERGQYMMQIACKYNYTDLIKYFAYFFFANKHTLSDDLQGNMVLDNYAYLSKLSCYGGGINHINIFWPILFEHYYNGEANVVDICDAIISSLSEHYDTDASGICCVYNEFLDSSPTIPQFEKHVRNLAICAAKRYLYGDRLYGNEELLPDLLSRQLDDKTAPVRLAMIPIIKQMSAELANMAIIWSGNDVTKLLPGGNEGNITTFVNLFLENGVYNEQFINMFDRFYCAAGDVEALLSLLKYQNSVVHNAIMEFRFEWMDALCQFDNRYAGLANAYYEYLLAPFHSLFSDDYEDDAYSMNVLPPDSLDLDLMRRLCFVEENAMLQALEEEEELDLVQ